MVVHHIWKAETEDYFEFKASLDNIAKTYLKIKKKKKKKECAGAGYGGTRL